MRTVWILGDQLHPEIGPLQNATPTETRVVMVESWAKLRSHQYHARKLVLLLSAMRHFAEELRARGFQVDYRAGEADFTTALRAHVAEYQPESLMVMAPSDWNGARYVATLGQRLSVPVIVAPNTLFLTSPEWFAQWAAQRQQLLMDDFYREQRRRLKVFVTDDGKPYGGRWSFDNENRKEAQAAAAQTYPPVPAFAPDALTREVIALVEREFPGAYGAIGDFTLPVTRADAQAAFEDFVEQRLRIFGPFEDALLAGEHVLAHSQVSLTLNLGLLSAAEIVARIVKAWETPRKPYPFNSLEGYVRQIIGWREFLRGMYWLKMPEYRTVNFFEATRPLPQSWWTGETRMRCVAESVGQVRATGYNHHVQRLMVLGNFALLAGIEPQQVNEWFRVAYVDAYEWVTLPNVLGMSQVADGGWLASKPNIGAAAYINKMSNYCNGCYFDPLKRTGERACPYNALYWDFLMRHERKLAGNPRISMMYHTLRQKSQEERTAIAQTAAEFLASDEMTPNEYL